MILSGLTSVKEIQNVVILTIALTNETFQMYNTDNCCNWRKHFYYATEMNAVTGKSQLLYIVISNAVTFSASEL